MHKSNNSNYNVQGMNIIRQRTVRKLFNQEVVKFSSSFRNLYFLRIKYPSSIWWGSRNSLNFVVVAFRFWFVVSWTLPPHGSSYLYINNQELNIQFYDERVEIAFPIVKYLFLKCWSTHDPIVSVYISQMVRLAHVCNYVFELMKEIFVLLWKN